MKHQLSLDIPDTNNSKILRIVDTSIYTNDIPYSCGVVEVTYPGFSSAVQIEVEKNFSLILNSCMLTVVGGCDDSMTSLIDGLYFIRYSISPNDQVYVEYNHLRMVETLNIYYDALCQLELSACDPPDEIKENLKELRLIKSLLDAAKAKVENCNSTIDGLDIFNYAKKRLSKYKSCCN